MTTATPTTKVTKTERVSHLRWLPISQMKISPKAQATFNKSRAEKIASDFDLEALGFLVVSERNGEWYVVDGQHRRAALMLMGWEDQQVQCEAYEGLTEAEEAELFLRRNEKRNPTAFDKFRVEITAGRDEATDINRVVMGTGLKISTDGEVRSISSIGSLRKVYELGGPVVLGRSLRILKDAFEGDALRFRAELINGMGLVCQRYNGTLDDEAAIARLSTVRGGAASILRKSNNYKLSTGHSNPHCAAAAIVDALNAAKGGRKLPSWWS